MKLRHVPFAALIAITAAACGELPPGPDPDPSAGSPGGAVEQIVFDGDGGHEVRTYARTPGVEGARRVEDRAPDVTTAAAPGACSTTGVQRAAVIVVVPPGTAPLMTNAQLDALFFGPGFPSLDGFLQEASYGQTSAAGDVYGPYTLDRAYACDETDAIRAAAIALADADVYFPDYQRLFILFPATGCSWNGMGTFGCSDLTSADGTFSASTSWLVAESMTRGDADDGLSIVNHEIGHNFGLMHAQSRDWGPEALAAPAVGSTLDEYGDLHSTMGMGRIFGRYPHYAAPHKLQIGWLAPEQVLTVDAAGSFAIAPYEDAPPGVRALKIRRPAYNEQWLWLEYRQPIGAYESTGYPEAWTGALLHHQDPANNGYSRLLDLTPQSQATDFLDAAMAPGTTFTDVYTGLGIALSSAGGGLTADVAYGAAPCMIGVPVATIVPPAAGARAGDTVDVPVTITSADTGACPPLQAFSVQPVQTQPGWQLSVTPDKLAVAWPGPGAATTLRVPVPATATVGDYALAVRVPRGTPFGPFNGNATLAVVPTVTAVAPVGPVPKNTTVTFTASVRNGGAPVPGNVVTFRLLRPDGSTVTGSGTTNAAGVASWSFKLKPPAGEHTLTATATVQGKAGTGAAPPFKTF